MHHFQHEYHHEKVKKVEGHHCSLPIDDETVDVYITGGACVSLRRKLRLQLLISASNPETKSFLRSSAQIRSEEIRHLRYYYYMIHPFSEARSVWETIMIIVYLTHFILMPVESMTPPGQKPLLLYIKFVSDIFAMVDVVLFFFTGFYDVNANKVVMNWKKVAIRYIFRFFIFDLLSSLPYNFVLLYTEMQTHLVYRVKYFYIFRLCRLRTLMAYIRKFLTKMGVWSHKMTALHSFLYLTIIIWWTSWWSFIAYALSNDLKPTYFETVGHVMMVMLDFFYDDVREFMLISTSIDHTSDALSIVLNLISLFVGSIFNILILSQVIRMYRIRAGARNKYEDLTQEIGKYTEYKELPTALKNRVFRYVEFKFQKNIFKQGEMKISNVLRRDIVLHNCKEMVEKVDVFKGLPSALILRIVGKLQSEIYLPNDTIVKAGVTGTAMFFIYTGTVAVYTNTQKEVCHLEDGSYFGEISLLINEPRVASVIAVTNCELFRLSRKEFLEVLEPFPSLSNKIKTLALSRLASTKMVMNQDEKEDEDSI